MLAHQDYQVEMVMMDHQDLWDPQDHLDQEENRDAMV